MATTKFQTAAAPGDDPQAVKVWPTYLVVLAAAGLLYMLTVAPGPLWQDSGMAQVRVVKQDYVGDLGLALAHPLFYLVARVFQFLPFHDSAYKTNLVSAVFAALTVANVFVLLNRMLPTSGQRRAAVIVATISLALSHTFWQHAALAEVYTLSTFLLTCQLLALVRFIYRRNVGWWLLFAFLNGLECSNHVLALITLTAFAVWSLFLFRSGQLNPGWILPAMALWMFGCLPYEYLGYQAWASGQPMADVLHSMLFGRYQAQVLNIRLDVRLILASFLIIGLNFPTPNLALVPFGLATARRIIPASLFNFLLLATLLHLLFAVRYPVRDQYTFFIVPVLFLSIWLAFGVAWALDFRSPRLFKPLIAFALLPIPVYAALPTLIHRFAPAFAYPPVPYRDAAEFFFWPWKTGYRGADQFAREVFKQTGPDAIILADDTTARPLIYYQLTRKKRTDLEITSDLYPDLSHEQKVTTLIHTLHQRQVWVVRPYPGYAPEWILNNFRLVAQGPIYRITEPKSPTANRISFDYTPRTRRPVGFRNGSFIPFGIRCKVM